MNTARGNIMGGQGMMRGGMMASGMEVWLVGWEP